MATRDNNDRGLGDFAAMLIEAGGDGSLGEEVRRSVTEDRPSDPVTALVWPLLPTDAKEYKRASKLQKVARQRHNRAVFQAIEQAATTLATHERVQGNRLRALQRAVQFVCVATHTHAQALAAGGDLANRTPALVAMGGQRRSDVALASERSLDLLYGSLEEWLGRRLGARLGAGEGFGAEGPTVTLSLDGRQVRPLLQAIGAAKKPHDAPSKDELDARVATFQTLRRERGDDAALVLGHTLVSCYAREYESGGPRRFLQAIGRKVGLLYPHFQGAARDKRVRPSVPVIDMLVRACVHAGDSVPLDDFLERLWQRFGLLLGGRRSDEWDDVAALERAGLAVDADILMQNTEAFVDQIVVMGLGRRYPDGVTFVGDGHGA